MSDQSRRGLFAPPPPEARLVEDPYRARWRPRREAVGEDGDEIAPQRLAGMERFTDATMVSPVHLVTTPPAPSVPIRPDESDDAELEVVMPDVPPIQPGEPDDLRLPNPDRWARPGDLGLPAWFWGVVAFVAVLAGLWIAWGQHPSRATFSEDAVGAE